MKATIFAPPGARGAQSFMENDAAITGGLAAMDDTALDHGEARFHS